MSAAGTPVTDKLTTVSSARPATLRLHQRLSMRISACILLMEVLILGLLGWYYVASYWQQIDRRTGTEIQIPGTLMDQGVLRYGAVADLPVLQRLVSQDIRLALVLEPDGRIFEASQPSLRGEHIATALPGFEFDLLHPTGPARLQSSTTTVGPLLACLTPLSSQGRHIGWCYLQVDTRRAEAEKLRLAWRYAAATLLSILLTWAGIMVLVGRLTRQRLSDTLSVLSQAQHGNLTVRTHAIDMDEIGQLQRGIDAMLAEIEARTGDLDATAAALRASENDLHITLDSIGDGVIATDDQGRITRLNPVAERLTGWREAEAAGQPLTAVFTIVHAHTRATEPNPVAQVLATGAQVGLVSHTVLVARDGSEAHIADSAAPIRDQDGHIRGVVLVFRDISAQHDLENRLLHGQKMDAIGQLAGGVAHDFNNMLTAILGGCEMLAPSTLAPRQQKAVHLIQDGAMRAADLTRKLLSFARKQQPAMNTVDVHDIIRASAALLERTVDRRIRITSDLQAVPHLVTGDATMLQTALLNLGINARDAMPEGGQLTFTTCLATGPACADGTAKHHLELRVTDTGHGISATDLPRIFEPFFTTKEVGKGTGLGLSVVFSTMRDQGGSITVASVPGQGAVFTLRLPLAVTNLDPTPTRGAPLKRGSGTVLVIEDEPLLREVVCHHLDVLGYATIEAADGANGLTLYADRQDEVVAVLLDMVMPGLGGREVFMRLRALNPKVRVILCSGFDRAGAIEELLALGANGFVAKPYGRTALGRALQS